MSWEQAVQERQEIFFATSSKEGKPHVIVVLSLGLVEKKVLIGACLMETSIKNIQNNNKVSFVVKYKNEYYRVEGLATIYSTGKFFDNAYKKSKPPMPKSAITIDVTEVWDLNNQKKIL
jgi:uncharacterized pyridoxamine 5'-phosphate oxidase family protein